MPPPTTLPLLLALAGTLQAQGYQKLSGPLPTYDSTIESWSLTPDGARVVFERYDFSGERGVFSAPLDGGSEAALTAGLPGKSRGFALSPDGTEVVVLQQTGPASQPPYVFYRVPVGGGTPVLLVALSNAGVHSFQISATGTRLVYFATTGTGLELWSMPLDASTPPVKLNTPLAPGRAIYSNYRLSHGGLRVLYVSDHDADEVYDLYSVPTDGSQPPVRLNVSRPQADVADFRISHDNLSVLYLADQDTDEQRELYVTSIFGGITPLKRSGPLVAGGNVTSWHLAAASHRLVFVADAEQDERFELYSLDPTAAGTRVKLSGALASDRDVVDARVSDDGLWVAYRSDQETPGALELFGVPATGGSTPVRLSEPLGPLDSVHADYRIEGGAGRALFQRDMGVPGPSPSLQVFSVPLDGSLPAVRLNGELAERGTATLLGASSTAAWFTATVTPGLPELFRTALDGSATPLALSPALAAGARIVAARLAAGGTRIVYELASGSWSEQLLSVPVVGGESTPISGSHGPGTYQVGGVGYSAFAGKRALYVGTEAPARAYELFSASLDGTSGSIRLGRAPTIASPQTLVVTPDAERVLYVVDAYGPGQLCSARIGVADSEVVLARDAAAFDGLEEGVTDFALFPDGETVLFALAGGGTTRVLRSRIDGGQPVEELLSWPDTVRMHLAPDGSWVVLAGPAGLYAWPLDGHQPAQRLDLGATDFPHVVLTPDSSRVLFATSGAGAGLFSAPLDASHATVSLGAGVVSSLELTHDGMGVLYLADTDAAYGDELYHAPLDGSTPPEWLGGPNVRFFQEDEATGRVLYFDLASQLLSSVPVLGGGAPTVLAYGWLTPMAERPLRIRGGHALYLAIHIACNSYQDVARLYSVPVGGGAPPIRLDLPSCDRSVFPTVEPFDFGRRALFVHRPDASATPVLYQRAFDGSGATQRVAGPSWLSAGTIALSPDGGTLLCRTDQDARPGVTELYALRLAPRTRVGR